MSYKVTGPNIGSISKNGAGLDNVWRIRGIYLIFFYVIDFTSKLYDQKESLDLVKRIKYTTIIFILYILLFTKMNQIFTFFVFILLLLLIVFNYIINHLKNIKEKNSTYQDKKKELLIHQINYGLCLGIIIFMIIGTLINYVQKKSNTKK